MSPALTGDLDYDTCGELLRRVHSALDDREDVGDLRLDCRELGAVDSMGLSTLLQIHRSAGHYGIGSTWTASAQRCDASSNSPAPMRM